MHRTTALRVADLTHEENLKAKIERVVTDRNKVLKALYDAPPLDWKEIFESYRDYGRRMLPYVADTTHLLIQLYKAGKRIVFEGAHAVLLDVDHGTYPYVTSSSCSALGLYTGAGAPPQTVQNFVGIMKAYSTRVGGGPFPTEQDNNIGQYIRERGNEYGTTTKRPRRCGWFDAMAVKYSVDLCGITHIALTLLDVLSGLDRIQGLHGLQVSRVENGILPRGYGRAGRSRADLRNASGLERKHLRLPSIRRIAEGSPELRENARETRRRPDQARERRRGSQRDADPLN